MTSCTAQLIGLSRSRSSLPALKCGTALPGTATSSPVRGLRPIRCTPPAGGEGAEAAQLDPIATCQGRDDLLEHRVHDPLDVAGVEMRIGGGKPLDQTGSGHASSPPIPTFCSVLRSRSTALARTCCAARCSSRFDQKGRGLPPAVARSRYRDQDTPSMQRGSLGCCAATGKATGSPGSRGSCGRSAPRERRSGPPSPCCPK